MGGTSASRLSSQISSTTRGASGGSQSHTLSTSEMPSHNHSLPWDPIYFQAYVYPQANNTMQNFSSRNTGNTGGGGSHNNVQPTMVMNYIIYAGV